MRWRVVIVGALLAAVVAGGCIEGPAPGEANQAATQTEPLWFDAVRGPDEAVEVIQRLAGMPGVDVEEIGRSVEDRAIHTVTIGEGPFTLWVVGRHHGNEPSGMEAILLVMELLADDAVVLPEEAPEILHDLQAHRELLLERLTFVFIPVANPDGSEAYTRGNANGVDLNRDYFAFSEIESQVIREAFWVHRPDGCIDLHNIGLSDNDYEAYGPEGPLLDPVMEALMLKDSWYAVHEVDAAGGRASGFNEDYRAPEPLHDHPWPEVYHPGTHDFFCTSRGAPGWTPEGSIPSGENGATAPQFAWSSKLHAITVASSSFHWAGVYDNADRMIHKAPTTTGTGGDLEVEVPEEHADGQALFQVTYRPLTSYADHSPLPVTFTVSAPDGTTHEGRTPGPYQWTSNVLVEDPAPGTYRLEFLSAVPVEHQLRAYSQDAAAPLASATRTTDGFSVSASEDAPGTVEITLTDIAQGGAYSAAEADPMPDEVHELEGPVHERSLARWSLTVEPGEETTIQVDRLEDDNPGPHRFTATSGDRHYMWHATEPRVARS